MTPPSSRPAKPFRPLNRRVVGWVLLFSTLFTLVITSVLIAIDYRDERDNALDQLRFASVIYRKSLANSLWDIDMPAVRLQLDGLASFPMVGHVVLTTSIGQTMQVDKYTDKAHKHDPDDPLSLKDTLYSPHDPKQVVGHLQLYVDRDAFLRRIETVAIRILAGEALKGLVLGLLIAWLIARLVTRHLSHMAAHVAALHPTALGAPLMLQRHEMHHHDELDRLCDSFNGLNRQLVEYIDNQRVLEDELRGHRDHLSDLVSERTRSLERLRGFHALIIHVLTRFINLPPGHANEAVDYALGVFGDYFGANRCLLYTYDQQAQGFGIVNAWPTLAARGGTDDVFLSDDVLPHRLQKDNQSRIWLCATRENAGDDRMLALFGSEAAYTAVGIEVKGNTVGLLCLVGCAMPEGSDNANLLELAARVSANMLDHKAAQMTLLDMQEALQKANRELQSLIRHDALTGLANRRYFDELKEVEFRRALRIERPLSVLMCDIDQFKRYNDTYGHAQGDRCLVAVAACLKSLFNRAGDLVARLGGEEFAVLLPNTDPDHAHMLAERIRKAVWDLNLQHISSSVADRVTISLGVACIKPGLHANFDALLHDADQALYRAKNGRNQAVMAE